MCEAKNKSNARRKPIFLTSLKSFSSDDGTPPSKFSSFATAVLVIALLVASEQLLRYVFFSCQHLHPLLENETNRWILARHIGVDALSCVACAVLGWASRGINDDMFSSVLRRTKGMPEAGYERRMFGYQPAAFRICLVFFAYQAKNLYDTIVWGDGPAYVFHHVMSMTAAYVGLSGVCHYYSVFFLGLSEISTAILCVLANFDEETGVPELGEAFPMTKVSIGVCFVIAFIVCRVIMWPVVGYYFVKDCTLAIRDDNSVRAKQYRPMLHALRVSFTGLTMLQVVFVFMILVIAKKELEALGLI